MLLIEELVSNIADTKVDSEESSTSEDNLNIDSELYEIIMVNIKEIAKEKKWSTIFNTFFSTQLDEQFEKENISKDSEIYTSFIKIKDIIITFENLTIDLESADTIPKPELLKLVKEYEDLLITWTELRIVVLEQLYGINEESELLKSLFIFVLITDNIVVSLLPLYVEKTVFKRDDMKDELAAHDEKIKVELQNIENLYVEKNNIKTDKE